MNDMSSVIIPKSDQINADDLIAGPRVVTITGVAIKPDTEQPVSISIDGDKRVWRPCKTMSRLLVKAWGSDANKYVGRSVKLYHDPSVKWGGMQVGGVRISHMSHIEHEFLMALSETRGKKVIHKVLPLQVPQQQASKQDDPAAVRADAEKWLAKYESDVTNAASMDELEQVHAKASRAMKKLETLFPDLHAKAVALAHTPEGRAEEQMGEETFGGRE